MRPKRQLPVCAGFISSIAYFSSCHFNVVILSHATPQSIAGNVQHPEDRARSRVARERGRERRIEGVTEVGGREGF